ncbi:MAG: hypothetical protein OHK0029_31220 [Armatimonadaceae bacterium]
MNRERRRYWMIGGALLGAVCFGFVGYLFGFYAFQEVGLADSFPEFYSESGTGAMFGWLAAILGGFVGVRFGQAMRRRNEVRNRKREWRETHPEEYAEFQQEQQRQRERRRRKKVRSR